jgi:hypothetical protein
MVGSIWHVGKMAAEWWNLLVGNRAKASWSDSRAALAHSDTSRWRAVGGAHSLPLAPTHPLGETRKMDEHDDYADPVPPPRVPSPFPALASAVLFMVLAVIAVCGLARMGKF